MTFIIYLFFTKLRITQDSIRHQKEKRKRKKDVLFKNKTNLKWHSFNGWTTLLLCSLGIPPSLRLDFSFIFFFKKKKKWSNATHNPKCYDLVVREVILFTQCFSLNLFQSFCCAKYKHHLQNYKRYGVLSIFETTVVPCIYNNLIVIYQNNDG